MKELSWRGCFRAGAALASALLLYAARDPLFSLLRRLLDAAAPLLAGAGVAYAAGLVQNALERRLFPHGGRAAFAVCLVLTLLLALGAAAALVGLVLPEMGRCAALLLKALPNALEKADALLPWLTTQTLPDSRPERVLSLLTTGLSGLLEAAAGLLSGASRVLTAGMFALCLLAERRRILHGLRCMLTRSSAGKAALRVVSALDKALRAFLAGQVTDALLVGSLCFLGMALMKLPLACTVSVLCGVLALIPAVGGVLATALGTVLLLPFGTGRAALFFVFFALLQLAEGQVIYPRIVGVSLGLPSAWVLASAALGGGLFGLPGMLLGPPAAAAAQTLLTRGCPTSSGRE